MRLILKEAGHEGDDLRSPLHCILYLSLVTGGGSFGSHCWLNLLVSPSLRYLRPWNFPFPPLILAFFPHSTFGSSTSLPSATHTPITMADDDRRVKRSRFDQTELESRRSRFDRRSRSPSARQSESARTRSPLSREPRSPAGDASAKASVDPAAAAGKIDTVEDGLRAFELLTLVFFFFE